jgi:single-strand selective monofunctional uracil DNA glycosylase
MIHALFGFHLFLFSMPAEALITAAKQLAADLKTLTFSEPTTHVYCPLDYAWAMHEAYIRRYAATEKRVIFVGMNPGPWGMTQTGVPFGEIPAVRDWMQLSAQVGRPEQEHVKRRVVGLSCTQSEVSGRRLWGLFAQRFGPAEAFFKEHFVANYCPLVFMESSGRNRTPDKLPAHETAAMEAACDAHLRAVISALKPEWVIGVGAFAEERAQRAQVGSAHAFRVGRVLHPSPASPAANRDWAGTATKQLIQQGVWQEL